MLSFSNPYMSELQMASGVTNSSFPFVRSFSHLLSHPLPLFIFSKCYLLATYTCLNYRWPVVSQTHLFHSFVLSLSSSFSSSSSLHLLQVLSFSNPYMSELQMASGVTNSHLSHSFVLSLIFLSHPLPLFIFSKCYLLATHTCLN